jgi:hypothetical protein
MGNARYFGWDPPGGGLAIIKGSAYYWVFHVSAIRITSVDSISTGYEPNVLISPGKHTVIVEYESRRFKLVFDVEAGHKYNIKLKSPWRKPSLLVVDTQSGIVVGSSD